MSLTFLTHGFKLVLLVVCKGSGILTHLGSHVDRELPLGVSCLWELPFFREMCFPRLLFELCGNEPYEPLGVNYGFNR